MEEKTQNYVQLLALLQEGADCGEECMLLGFFLVFNDSCAGLYSCLSFNAKQKLLFRSNCCFGTNGSRHQFCLQISQLCILQSEVPSLGCYWYSVVQVLRRLSVLPLPCYSCVRGRGLQPESCLSDVVPFLFTQPWGMVIFSSQFLLPACLLLPLHCPGSLLLPSQLFYPVAQSCVLLAHAELWLALLCGAVSQPQLPWLLLSATCWAPAEIFSSCCSPCLTLDAGEPLQEAHCLPPWSWSLGGLRRSWRPARPIARGRHRGCSRLLVPSWWVTTWTEASLCIIKLVQSMFASKDPPWTIRRCWARKLLDKSRGEWVGAMPAGVTPCL